MTVDDDRETRIPRSATRSTTAEQSGRLTSTGLPVLNKSDGEPSHPPWMDQPWVLPAWSGLFATVLWTFLFHFGMGMASHAHRDWVLSATMGLAFGLVMFDGGFLTGVAIEAARSNRNAALGQALVDDAYAT